MLNLLLTILCSTSIAIILKISGNIKGNTIQLLAGNYLSASLIGLILILSQRNVGTDWELIPLGLFLSILFVGSIFSFSKSVILSGAALSTVSSRLSVFVPIVLSIIIYNELPNFFQLFGLFFTAITILLFYISIKSSSKTPQNTVRFIYLIGVLLGIGIADFFMKVFQVHWQSSDKPWFLFWIFLFSFLITSVIALRQRKKKDKKSIVLGILMGIPNIFSSFFLIEALKSYSAVIVYPFVNMSIIVITSIIVKLAWKEYWNSFAVIGIFTGILSIILLSL